MLHFPSRCDKCPESHTQCALLLVHQVCKGLSVTFLNAPDELSRVMSNAVRAIKGNSDPLISYL